MITYTANVLIIMCDYPADLFLSNTQRLKGAMSPHTHARANESKLEKVGPSFSSPVGDFGRLFLSV